MGEVRGAQKSTKTKDSQKEKKSPHKHTETENERGYHIASQDSEKGQGRRNDSESQLLDHHQRTRKN